MNFKLGHEIRKVNWSTWNECGTKKKSESSTAIEPMTFGTPGGCSIHCARTTHGEQGHLTEFIRNRHPAYCWNQHCSSHRECDKRLKMVDFYSLHSWWLDLTQFNDFAFHEFGRSWVRFLSEAQMFSLSHARVTLISSLFTYLFSKNCKVTLFVTMFCFLVKHFVPSVHVLSSYMWNRKHFLPAGSCCCCCWSCCCCCCCCCCWPEEKLS